MPRSAVHHLEGPFRRFWFPTTRGFGVGVTACTELEAAMLANTALAHLPAGATFDGDVVADVDIGSLDRENVRRHMGQPHMHGVWFPPHRVSAGGAHASWPAQRQQG